MGRWLGVAALLSHAMGAGCGGAQPVADDERLASTSDEVSVSQVTSKEITTFLESPSPAASSAALVRGLRERGATAQDLAEGALVALEPSEPEASLWAIAVLEEVSAEPDLPAALTEQIVGGLVAFLSNRTPSASLQKRAARLAGRLYRDSGCCEAGLVRLAERLGPTGGLELAYPLLESRASTEAFVQEIRRWLSAPDRDHRARALRLVFDYAAQLGGLREAVVTSLQDEDYEVWRAAMRALGAMGDLNSHEVSMILSDTDSLGAPVDAMDIAVVALANVQEASAHLLWEKAQELTKYGREVRIRAIARLGSRAPGALVFIRDALGDNDRWVRLHAASAIWGLYQDQSALCDWVASIDVTDLPASGLAIVLGELEGLDVERRLLRFLRQTSAHENESVRKGSVRTLRTLRGGINPVMREWLLHEDRRVREAASLVLAGTNPR